MYFPSNKTPGGELNTRVNPGGPGADQGEYLAGVENPLGVSEGHGARGEPGARVPLNDQLTTDPATRRSAANRPPRLLGKRRSAGPPDPERPLGLASLFTAPEPTGRSVEGVLTLEGGANSRVPGPLMVGPPGTENVASIPRVTKGPGAPIVCAPPSLVIGRLKPRQDAQREDES